MCVFIGVLHFHARFVSDCSHFEVRLNDFLAVWNLFVMIFKSFLIFVIVCVCGCCHIYISLSHQDSLGLKTSLNAFIFYKNVPF